MTASDALLQPVKSAFLKRLRSEDNAGQFYFWHNSEAVIAYYLTAHGLTFKSPELQGADFPMRVVRFFQPKFSTALRRAVAWKISPEEQQRFLETELPRTTLPFPQSAIWVEFAAPMPVPANLYGPAESPKLTREDPYLGCLVIPMDQPKRHLMIAFLGEESFTTMAWPDPFTPEFPELQDAPLTLLEGMMHPDSPLMRKFEATGRGAVIAWQRRLYRLVLNFIAAHPYMLDVAPPARAPAKPVVQATGDTRHEPLAQLELRLNAHVCDARRLDETLWNHLPDLHVQAMQRKDWTAQVFVPRRIIQERLETRGSLQAGIHQSGVDAEVFAMLSTWRIGRGVYRLDETVLNEVWLMAAPKALPVDALNTLPEWAVYVPTPGRVGPLTMNTQGFYARVEPAYATGSGSVLYILMDVADEQGQRLVPLSFPLAGQNIEEALRSAAHGQTEIPDLRIQAALLSEQMIDDFSRYLTQVANTLLFLVQQDRDFTRRGTSGTPSLPVATGKKTKQRLQVASNTSVWDVGIRMGAALRTAYSEDLTAQAPGAGAGREVRPHLRRAHYHSYWKGPRDRPQTLIVKWLPPIAVMMNLGDDTPIVVRPLEA